MIIHPHKGVDTGDRIAEGKNKQHLLIDKYISERQEPTTRLEQKNFISEQNNMLVYKMHAISQKNKFKLKKHLTLPDILQDSAPQPLPTTSNKTRPIYTKYCNWAFVLLNGHNDSRNMLRQKLIINI